MPSAVAPRLSSAQELGRVLSRAWVQGLRVGRGSRKELIGGGRVDLSVPRGTAARAIGVRERERQARFREGTIDRSRVDLSVPRGTAARAIGVRERERLE